MLGLLGLEALDTNCEGRFEVHDDGGDSVQLFYLPHCPKQLSNNLLWANWSAEKLRKLVVVGNSFERILLLPEKVQCIIFTRIYRVGLHYLLLISVTELLL